MVSQNTRIGIIGGGTSGIYLAALLVRQGYTVDVFERSPQPRTEGCGILLISSGLSALAKGIPTLSPKLVDLGVVAKTYEFRNLLGGVVESANETYEDQDFPSILIHRGAILETLLAELPPNRLHFNAHFESALKTETGVKAHFRSGQTWEGDLLIGADGLFSRVRDCVVPGVQPVYLGDIVWRGVIADSAFCTDGLFIVYVRGRGIYANFFDLGQGLTHWGFFLEAPQSPDEMGLPRPEQVGIPPEALAKLPPDPRRIIAETAPEQITCNFSYDLDPLPHLYTGRILLIGDAAHAKSPTRARGMTAGFEDAIALSQHLSAAEDIDSAIAAFQTERLPIVHEYQRSSREVSQKIGRSKRKASSAS